jgi:hypothetical protein
VVSPPGDVKDRLLPLFISRILNTTYCCTYLNESSRYPGSVVIYFEGVGELEVVVVVW